MVQAASRRLLVAEARVRFQAKRKIGTGYRLSSEHCRFSLSVSLHQCYILVCPSVTDAV